MPKRVSNLVRVEPKVLDQVRKYCDTKGKNISDVTRVALEMYMLKVRTQPAALRARRERRISEGAHAFNCSKCGYRIITKLPVGFWTKCYNCVRTGRSKSGVTKVR